MNKKIKLFILPSLLIVILVVCFIYNNKRIEDDHHSEMTDFLFDTKNIKYVVLYQYNNSEKENEVGGMVVKDKEDEIVNVLYNAKENNPKDIIVSDLDKYSVQGGVTFCIRYIDGSELGVYWDFPNNRVSMLHKDYYLDKDSINVLSKIVYDYWEE